MEYLIINANKLKIIMNEKDMKRFGIKDDVTDFSDPSLKRSLWRVLDSAKEEAGFDVTGDKILIQMYTTERGSEIFVTKLSRLAEGSERSISRSQNVAMLESRRVIYKFSSLDALIRASSALGREARTRPVLIYRGDGGEYYLVIESRASSAFSDVVTLGEYGTEIPTSLEPYIAEHSVSRLPVTSLAPLAEL